MKKLILPAFAIALAFGTSAFTAKKAAGVFYRYTSSSLTEANIKNINNYERESATCNPGANVCGVLLDTDNGEESQPDEAEFTAQRNHLWTSQQNGLPANASIVMKN